MWRNALVFLGASGAALAAEVSRAAPRLVDDRLQLVLYASDPDIVTPIGAAVDARGRLFVIESHTHLRASGYAGPKHDRIKVFVGTGPDGRAGKTSVFADDLTQAMNLAFAPDGTLHVCTSKAVYALADRDHDGRAETRTTVLTLETKQAYPHNQLLGLTFSADGWLYVSRGNVGGYPYAWVGADRTRLAVYGDGGDIVRCRADGTRLERIATGFWNPFDLRFDRHGRLLCVDNDPDSRGPNRLLHIVPGGDYGFRALYGPSGLHPYAAWEGELPGTLPMIAPTGEAPSAVLDLSAAALPAEYRDTLLVTVWGEHTLALYRPRVHGASLRAKPEPFARGGDFFRPVALAPAPDGSIYVTDWVLKDYPNHGYGRIWKLSARSGASAVASVPMVAAPEAPRAPDALAALRSDDPFERNAGIVGLSRPAQRAIRDRALSDPDPRIREGALLALRRAPPADPLPVLRARLADSDPRVREVALMWTGDRVLRSLSDEVDATLLLPGVDARFFELWLATVQILRSDAGRLSIAQTPGFQIKRPLDPALLASLARDEGRPVALRAAAIARMADAESPETRELLLRLARGGERELQLAAVQRLASSAHGETTAVLCALAFDRTPSPEVRAEAVLALWGRAEVDLAPLLADPEPSVRGQAARALRSPAHLDATPKPDSLADWQDALKAGGDAAAGRRVFFSPVAACAACHRIGGRGGAVGPDLSVVARTATRAQLIHSIVKPSDDIAPQYQGWKVRLESGEAVTGLQGHARTGGDISLLGFDGGEMRIAARDVASFAAMSDSLMPEGLAAGLTVAEFRDLVAYLETLR